MTKLRNLLYALEEAKERIGQIEHDRDMFLEPILTELHATGGGISNCFISDNNLYVERTGSCRGCRWDDDYKFPLSIFECQDPIAAARKYNLEQKKLKEDQERREKISEIKRLQKELES